MHEKTDLTNYKHSSAKLLLATVAYVALFPVWLLFGFGAGMAVALDEYPVMCSAFLIYPVVMTGVLGRAWYMHFQNKQSKNTGYQLLLPGLVLLTAFGLYVFHAMRG